jgi:hypothetical protein
MADVSLGTFEVTALQQVGTTGPGGTPSAPTVNMSLVMLTPPAGAGPATFTVSGLPIAQGGHLASVTLGKDYEIIFREVPPIP